jgi:16S rRNA (cytosine1402-N4)-methyltransferase
VHVPVLLDAVLAQLALRPGARCIDATIDGGGHTAALLAATAPDGMVLGIDRDPHVLAALRDRLAGPLAAGRLRAVHGNFCHLGALAAANGFRAVDAVLFDLGVSSYHLDASGRGFSTRRDEPLDLRFDPDDPAAAPAAALLATRDAAALTALLRTFGEERFASRIARTIVARRRVAPVTTSAALLDCVAASLPPAQRWRAARHAARVFQALRIAVNDELGAVRDALPQAVDLLRPGGRLAVISFHSLEDRIVKQFLRAQAAAGRVRVLTKRPIVPSDAEVAANPRAASGKLRVAERCGLPHPHPLPEGEGTPSPARRGSG